MELFVGIILVLGIATLLMAVAVRVGLPDLIGAILAGVLLGPSVLGLIGSEEGAPLPQAFTALASAGLVALMASAGLGINRAGTEGPGRLIPVLIIGTLLSLLPAFASAPLISAIAPDPQVGAEAGSAAAYQGLLALAAIVTSVPFLTKIYFNTGLTSTSFARGTLEFACLIDLVVWSLFGAVQALKSGGAQSAMPLLLSFSGTLVFAVGCILLVKLCASGVETWLAGWPALAREALLVAMVGCLAALLGRALGVHLMLAALVLGFSLQLHAGGVKALRRWTDPVASRLLTPLYFAVAGLSLDMRRDFDLRLILAFLAWSSTIKMGCTFTIVYWMRRSRRVALTYALVLNTRGGPGIALASLGLSSGLIGESTFIALVFASIVTAIASEAWLKRIKPALLLDEALPLSSGGPAPRVGPDAPAPS
nr:cation:proton antiporter [Myxococcus sp. MH1]